MYAECSRTASEVALVRLNAGECLMESFTRLMARTSWPSAVLASAIGSLSELRYSFAALDADGRPGYSPPRTERGPVEVASMQGHLGRTSDGEPQVHLHGVFTTSTGSVVAGHVHAARVLITIEIGLLCPPDLAWQRRVTQDPRHPGLPVLQPARADPVAELRPRDQAPAWVFI